jgi:serine/threonine kinase PknH
VSLRDFRDPDSMIRALLLAAAIAAAAMSAAPTASADPYDDLIGMLPPGYGPDSCHPIPPKAALALLECGPNSLPGGPSHARYMLFDDPAFVSKIFGGITKEPDRTLIPCFPGDTAVPGSWGNPAGTDGGMFTCSTSGGAAELTWTSHSNHLLAHADGPEVVAVFKWWWNNVHT